VALRRAEPGVVFGWGPGLLADAGTLFAVSGRFDGIHGRENAVNSLDPATGAYRQRSAPGTADAAFGLYGTADGALFVGTNDDALSDEGDPTVALDPGVPTTTTAPAVGAEGVFVAESGDVGDGGTSRVVARDLAD
jgi:hypothetical protein